MKLFFRRGKCSLITSDHVYRWFHYMYLYFADHRAATIIQATWRGYWAREHNPDVVSVRKEIRARRAEDHIVVLRAELDRYTIKLSQKFALIPLIKAWCHVDCQFFSLLYFFDKYLLNFVYNNFVYRNCYCNSLF